MAKAEIWAERSVNLQNNSCNYDTYAALLFKLGKKKEAIAAEEKAVEIARKNGEQTEEYEKTLNKFKAEM